MTPNTKARRYGPLKLLRVGLLRSLVGVVLGVLALVLRVWRRVVVRYPPAHKVLLVEPFGMGDVVSLAPLACQLSTRGYRVDVCARNVWHPILPAKVLGTWVNSRLPWSQSNVSQKYDVRNYLSRDFLTCFRELRQVGCGSIGLDTRGDIRSIILMYAVGCREVYSLSRYIGSDLAVLPGAAHRIRAGSEARWRQNLAFLEAMGEGSASIEMPDLRHLVQAPDSGLRSKVGLIPIASWAGKEWISERWQELVGRLQAAGQSVVGLCGPGQMEAARRMLGKTVLIEECNSPEAWAKRLAALRLVLTVNTGPMHIADSLGVPVVVLDGPSRLPLWAPSGKQSVVLHHQDALRCAPCHQTVGGAACDCACMRLISVEDVWRAIECWLQAA